MTTNLRINVFNDRQAEVASYDLDKVGVIEVGRGVGNSRIPRITLKDREVSKDQIQITPANGQVALANHSQRVP